MFIDGTGGYAPDGGLLPMPDLVYSDGAMPISTNN